MKNFTKAFGIIAFVVVIGFSMVACGDEEETENQALNSITPYHIEKQGGWRYPLGDGAWTSIVFHVLILGEGEHEGECFGTLDPGFSGTWKIQKNDAGVFELEVTINGNIMGDDSLNGVYNGVLSNSGKTLKLTRTDGTGSLIFKD
ncbi:hypothetical protein R84B8_02597 [Treponema sp. R8-4-B8]